MKLWERFKRWCHGVPLEPQQELPGQRYFVVKGDSFTFDTCKPIYVRGEVLGDLWIKVTTGELRRAGLHMGITSNDTEWTYAWPFDSVAEISWDTFKIMRKLGD